jgi:5-methylcytosine-specific restriction protein A
MPARPMRPCPAPGCTRLVVRGRCDDHQKADRLAEDADRGSSAQRGYDARWRKLRAAFLKQHPLCMCDECKAGELRVTAAEVVDHIQPIEERPDLRLAWSNLRSMSKQHHDAHTARTRGWGRAHE